MGYSTNFEGKLKFSRELSLGEYNDLLKMNSDSAYCIKYSDKDDIPGSYMQWVSDKSGENLVWDGGEKFYNYVEWPKWLIEYYFSPRGIELNGIFEWQGDEVGDTGTITVRGHRITEEKLTATGQVECPNCNERFVPSGK